MLLAGFCARLPCNGRFDRALSRYPCVKKNRVLSFRFTYHLTQTTVILVQNGGDPLIQGSEGLNCLHLAIQFKHIDTVLYLCSTHRALLDAPTSPDKGSQTPLMFLITVWGRQKANRECVRKFTDMLRILISFGASVDTGNIIHAHYTSVHYDIILYTATKPSGDTALHMAMRVKNDVDAGAMCREVS